MHVDRNSVLIKFFNLYRAGSKEIFNKIDSALRSVKWLKPQSHNSIMTLWLKPNGLQTTGCQSIRHTRDQTQLLKRFLKKKNIPFVKTFLLFVFVCLFKLLYANQSKWITLMGWIIVVSLQGFPYEQKIFFYT